MSLIKIQNDKLKFISLSNHKQSLRGCKLIILLHVKCFNNFYATSTIRNYKQGKQKIGKNITLLYNPDYSSAEVQNIAQQ